MHPDSEFFRFFPLFFVAFGLLFTWAGARILLTGRRLRETGVRVPGLVVRNQWRSTGQGGGVYHPVLRFTTADGRDLQVRSDVGSNPAPAREGAQVTVVYDPMNPEKARMDSLLGRGNVVGVLLATIGVITTLVAAAISVNVLL